ncbi:MAG: permease-like cell division protein FtsX [Candidatus Peregrinibacteria bacterium]
MEQNQNKTMASFPLSFRRAVKNGILSLRRNKLLSAATVIVIALIFFVFNVVLALTFASASVIEKVGERIDISAEILPDVENYTIQTLLATLRDRPEIKEVIYVSKEDALKRFGSKYPNVITFLEGNRLENPLPNAIRIVSQGVADNNAILTYLEQPQFSRIINQEKLLKDQEQKTRNERVLDITRFLEQVGFWLILLFALVAVLILFNSISLAIHAHQKEITVMQLVGARHHFIAGGFVFEGMAIALLALALSVILSQTVLGMLAKNLLTVIENESLLVGLNAILYHFEDRLWFTLIWQILGALAVGAGSSWLAIQLYLKRHSSFS